MATSLFQRYVKSLTIQHENFEAERKHLLNNPRILQYLFEHPIHDRDDLVSASTALDPNCNPLHPPSIEVSNIDNSLIALMDARHNYAKLYERVQAHRSSLPPNKRPRLLVPYRPRPRPNPTLERMEDRLDDMGISFTTTFPFSLIEQHTNGAAPKPYNFEYDLTVDLLGCICDREDGSLHCRMYLFAIIDDTAKRQFTIKDHIDQYCLQRMRIHLFRIDHRSTPNDLTRFVRGIKRKGTYQSFNSLVHRVPNAMSQPSIIQFHTDYKYNHTTFCRHYRSSADEKDWDANRPIGTQPEPEPDCQVPTSFLNDLIARRYIPS